MSKPNPYLTGIFAPVAEERTHSNLKVKGELPRELSGHYLRNSPNPQFQPRGRYHWFDGDAMIHGIHFENGAASYKNRYVKTKHFQMEHQAGEPLWTGIMEPVNKTSPDGPDKDTANTSIIYHNGKVLSLWWLGGQPYQIGLADLETTGPETFGNTLKCGVAAHPKVDPVTGEMVFFDFSQFEAPYLTHGVISADGKVAKTATIDIPGPRLFHDIAITSNYTILMDLPLVWHEGKLAEGRRLTFFDQSLPSRFGIFPRHGSSGDIRWFETDPCYIFHTINAWEEGDSIIMYACRIENPIPGRRIEPGISRIELLQLKPVLCKFQFNLKTGQTTYNVLDDRYTEFPRMNDDCLTKKSRFSYHPRLARNAQLLFDALIKYDFETGASITHEFGPGRFGSEPVFVPRTAGAAEDDGYVLTYIYDTIREDWEVLVLDGKSFAQEPIAAVQIPCRVPIGFHAAWAPN